MTGSKALPPLHIGDIVIDPPIIQGGMGVRVSGPRLVSAVSNEGALGVIASVCTGEEGPNPHQSDYATRSSESLRMLIRETKALTSNPIGVNIISALTNYESLVRASVEENIDVIISGGGLPLKLPGLVSNPQVKLVPVVSTGRAADLICRTWKRKYKRLPDAIVVEGSLAGGHLGYAMEEVRTNRTSKLENELADVLKAVAPYGTDGRPPIPVIAAGGIFDGKDIARFLSAGASGVQIATRFVCTDECDASQAYKDAYIKAVEEDMTLITSPLGMPLRVIRNAFVDRILRGERTDFKCQYHCMLPCNPLKSQYCIAQALLNAFRGNMEKGFATGGANAYRIEKILSVHDLIQELTVQAALP